MHILQLRQAFSGLFPREIPGDEFCIFLPEQALIEGDAPVDQVAFRLVFLVVRFEKFKQDIFCPRVLASSFEVLKKLDFDLRGQFVVFQLVQQALYLQEDIALCLQQVSNQETFLDVQDIERSEHCQQCFIRHRGDKVGTEAQGLLEYIVDVGQSSLVVLDLSQVEDLDQDSAELLYHPEDIVFLHHRFAHSGKFCDSLVDTCHTALAAEHLHHLEKWGGRGAAADGYADCTEELSTAQAKLYCQVAHGCFHRLVRPCSKGCKKVAGAY